jgi:hypothetical protein
LFAGDPFQDLVNAARLPDNRAFRDDTQWYRDQHDALRDAARHAFSGDTVSGLKLRLTRLLDQIDAAVTRDPWNIDLLLFRLLVYRDLVEFALPDDPGYGNKLVAEAQRIESIFPRDFRAFWLLGAFYAYGARPLESVRQFETAIGSLKPEVLPTALWHDYASAAGLADMYKHALEACRIVAVLDKGYVMENDFVFRVANHFQTPGFSDDIPPGSLYQFQERENGFGLLCRLFGIYIPVDRAWGNQPASVENAGSLLVFSPEPVANPKNTAVTYTITVEFQAGVTVPFDEFVAARLKRFKSARKVEAVIGEYPLAVYELVDPGLDRPGRVFRGLIALLNRPEPEVKGLALERPVMSIFNPASGEPYYRPARAFDRYDGDIYYVVTLDCTDEIFTQAADVYRAFIKGMLFD